MLENHQMSKECIECGTHFIEEQTSIHFECERCIGRNEK